MIQISEVHIHFIKPADGLIGFASLVINGAIFMGSIGVHQKLDGKGYRITYPNKKASSEDRPVFHPINVASGQAIEQAIISKLKDVMSKPYVRHHRIDFGR